MFQNVPECSMSGAHRNVQNEQNEPNFAGTSAGFDGAESCGDASRSVLRADVPECAMSRRWSVLNNNARPGSVAGAARRSRMGEWLRSRLIVGALSTAGAVFVVTTIARAHPGHEQVALAYGDAPARGGAYGSGAVLPKNQVEITEKDG
jgi:hypothetical protein